MKAEKVYPVRGIRRCKNEECGVIMDRDYNAAINIRRNLLHFIDNGEWHPRFSKKKKEEESQQEPAAASAVAATVTTTTATTTSTYNSTATTR